MEKKNIFILAIIVILVLMYLFRMCETFTSGSFDITPLITIGMDWKGSQLSSLSVAPNNLIEPTQNMNSQIKTLQTYQKEDGTTNSKYINLHSNN